MWYAPIATFIISSALLCVRSKSRIDSFLQRLSSCLNSLISPRFFLFFDEYSMPFPAHSLILDRNIGPEPILAFNADTLMFFPYIPEMSFNDIVAQHKPIALPILSLEIFEVDGDYVRDLSGFNENIRYIPTAGHKPPVISDVVSAWIVTNMVPIDRSRFRVRYITDEGVERIVSLLDTTPLEDVIRDPRNLSDDSE